MPLYIVCVRLGWIGHLTPLIVPAFFGDAFSIFLLRQFFMTIPDELSDAARVDGASEWQIMTRVDRPAREAGDRCGRAVLLPLLLERPVRAVAVPGRQPAAVDAGDRVVRVPAAIRHRAWELTMAASALIMLPVIVLFFLAQKVFIEGVTLTGVKG